MIPRRCDAVVKEDAAAGVVPLVMPLAVAFIGRGSESTTRREWKPFRFGFGSGVKVEVTARAAVSHLPQPTTCGRPWAMRRDSIAPPDQPATTTMSSKKKTTPKVFTEHVRNGNGQSPVQPRHQSMHSRMVISQFELDKRPKWEGTSSASGPTLSGLSSRSFITLSCHPPCAFPRRSTTIFYS